jgi:putative flippase GtrA
MTMTQASKIARNAEWRARIAQFARFLLVGGLNTLVGYAIYALGLAASLPPEIALIGAFAFGIGFNYLTYGRLAFRRTGPGTFARFAFAYIILYGINVGALHIAFRLGATPLIAQAAVLPFMVALTFVIFKLTVFRSRSDA